MHSTLVLELFFAIPVVLHITFPLFGFCSCLPLFSLEIVSFCSFPVFTMSSVLQLRSRLFVLRSVFFSVPVPSHLFFITDNDFVHFVSTAFQITALLCYNFICSPNSCSLYYHCSLFSFHIFFEKLFFTVIILRSPNNCSSVLSSHLVTLSLSLNCSHIFFILFFSSFSCSMPSQLFSV